MMSLASHEVRIIGRRAAWPIALAGHAVAMSLFVALWGPTGGIPLWEASLLQQLVVADRIICAVVLTWLVTFILADDEGGGRSLMHWSLLTGKPAVSIFRARVVAAAAITLVFVSTALPVFVAAADISAAPARELTWQIASVAGFACLCAGITAVATAAIGDRVAIWIIAMLLTLLAAAGVQPLDTTVLRAAVPALTGVMLLGLAPSAAKDRRPADGR
jgi:hypothetical protein